MKCLYAIMQFTVEPIDNEALSELRNALRTMNRPSRQDMKRISAGINKTK
jgi:hypothetical protein